MAGRANVAVVAISASERQRAGQIQDFQQFQKRLVDLNLGNLEILPAMAYWDITFWDNCLWSDDGMEKLEKNIHDVLFPNVEFSWSAFCDTRGIPHNSESTGSDWRNAKCDVQALWAHIHHCRDVFVTSDKNFLSTSKRTALISLGVGAIVSPAATASLI
jgi:hypothetical protein